MSSTINLSSPEYQVFIGNDALKSLHDYLTGKTFILVDENTSKHCLPLFLEKSGLPPEEINLIEITSGEQYKTLGNCKYIWQNLTDEGANRNSVLINLGGGVITDMGGYAAACFKRGIRFINVPTTLMAQADAALGGKTGVNLDMIKNQVGLFQHPEAIFIDSDFLNTLKEEHLISGFAEVLKYGLIRDKELWETASMLNVNEISDWYELIIPCVKIKMDVVEKDPREKNLRKILNFGHTIGHAIETLSHKKNKPIPHGDAVAVGLVVESIISSKVMGLDKEFIDEVFRTIDSNFPSAQLADNDITELLKIMIHDKKNIDGEINFTLIENIGEAKINQFCSSVVIERSFIDFIHME